MAIATDCKSVRVSVRWFESTLPHKGNEIRNKKTPKINKMKIFVAKLAFKTTSEDLRALFEQYGTVESCKVIMDHETGRSKCYGFVEMPYDDEAYKAIVETDETVFMGNELQVKKSRPQPASATRHEQTFKPKRLHKPYVQKIYEQPATETDFFGNEA